jgi:hypothetical protein
MPYTKVEVYIEKEELNCVKNINKYILKFK